MFSVVLSMKAEGNPNVEAFSCKFTVNCREKFFMIIKFKIFIAFHGANKSLGNTFLNDDTVIVQSQLP